MHSHWQWCVLMSSLSSLKNARAVGKDGTLSFGTVKWWSNCHRRYYWTRLLVSVSTLSICLRKQRKWMTVGKRHIIHSGAIIISVCICVIFVFWISTINWLKKNISANFWSAPTNEQLKLLFDTFPELELVDKDRRSANDILGRMSQVIQTKDVCFLPSPQIEGLIKYLLISTSPIFHSILKLIRLHCSFWFWLNNLCFQSIGAIKHFHIFILCKKIFMATCFSNIDF